MYTISNFEKQIDVAILNKGKAYFKDDLVDNLEENDNNWTAEVEGSDTYNVEIKINNSNEIVSTFCDCPHDVSYCKHVVAGLFAIQKQLKTNIESPEKKQKKDIFENLLQKISLQEYQTFIKHLAKNNKGFKTDFELYFADKDDRIDLAVKYKDIIKKTIKKYTKHGYIDYHSTSSFINEIDKIIGVANEFNAKKNVKDSFEIAKTLLAEIVETVEYSDDSNGYIGGAIDEIIDIIGAISDRNDIAFEFKEQIFNYCGTELNKPVYFEYGDFGHNLLEVYKKLAIQLNFPEAFSTQLDRLLNKSKGESYLANHLIKVKVEFFEQTGRFDMAKSIIDENMHVVEIRKSRVKQAVDSKEYKIAKELIAEGIKIAEKNDHPGTVNQWKHLILDIAYLEKDTKTIKQLTKYFAFDRGTNVEYYNKWKKTFSKEEWTIEIETYISETIKIVTKEWNARKGIWRSEHPPILHALAQIYVEEKYFDRILPLIQMENDLNTTLEFHEFLKKDYSKELISLYLPAIKDFAARANDRNAYADMVRKMKKIIKDIPESKQEIMLLATALKMQYSVKPRRPAMIDELNKLF